MQTMTEWKQGRDGAQQKLIVFTCLKTGPAGLAEQQSHSFFFSLVILISKTRWTDVF